MSRIILVQPHAAARKSIENALAAAGHSVLALATIRDVEKVGDAFDVGIFELELPDGSGLHLAARLSGFGRLRTRLFTTADPTSALARRAAPMGLVIAREAPAAEVLAALEQVLQSAEQDTGILRSQVRPSLATHTWPQSSRATGTREK